MFDLGPINDAMTPFPQSAPYAAAMGACGAQVFMATMSCCSALVVQRGPLRLISRGPTWADGAAPSDQRQALRRLARWPGLTMATSECDVQGLGLIPLVTPLHHAIWDLSGNARARLRRNWRGHLTSAERRGICATAGNAVTLAQLVARDAMQSRTRGYLGYKPDFTNALPPESLRLWEWRRGRDLAAAMAFVVHGISASYHLGWSGPEARKEGAHNIMLWQAAMTLRAEGVRWLDLGSVNDQEAPGLAAFKLGTGAALRRLGHTMLVLPG